MNQITDLPPDSTFGLDFNYAAWTPDTVVTLCNVPWNNDYRDIVKFNTPADLNTYINSRPNYVASDVSYHKVATSVKLDVPFNAAYKFNYLRAHNGVQPLNVAGDEARDFYYFVTDVRYVAPDTTEFIIQLDVWATFQFYATFGNCYIEHGHIGIANQDAFTNYGRDNLTTPEGIDVGNEYQVITQATQAIMAYDAADAADINNAVAYDILICSTVDLLADPGDKTSPNLVSTDGGNFFTLPSGANYYVFSGKSQAFQLYLHGMKDRPWVTQGIISITTIPPINRYIPGFTFTDGLPTLAPTQLMAPLRYAMMNNWRNNTDIINNIPERYRGLKKFFTFPYMVLELTTFTGTPILIKPEAWADDNATVLERISPLPPNQRVTIGPYKYNAKPGSPTAPLIPGIDASGVGGDDYGDYLDIATQISNFPTLAIVNNGAIAYLAANAHGIAYQYSSADWAETRALHGNAVSYDQASAGMGLTQQLTGIGIGADRAQNAIQNTIENQQALMGAIGSVVNGASGGIGAGGLPGAAAGLVGGLSSAALGAVQHGLNIANNQASLGVRNSAAQQSADASTGTAGIIRDTNKDLGDWSARGDYQNAIAATNAKVQDAKLIQPTTSGQVGGEALNLINNTAVVSLRVKMIDQAAIRRIGDYWLRYGYAVGRFATMPTSLMVMEKFTYWKLKESYIVSASMPEAFKQVLRGIFEKGVTVWADPADIGNIDIANNAPIGGITL